MVHVTVPDFLLLLIKRLVAAPAFLQLVVRICMPGSFCPSLDRSIKHDVIPRAGVIGWPFGHAGPPPIVHDVFFPVFAGLIVIEAIALVQDRRNMLAKDSVKGYLSESSYALNLVDNVNLRDQELRSDISESSASEPHVLDICG